MFMLFLKQQVMFVFLIPGLGATAALWLYVPTATPPHSPLRKPEPRGFSSRLALLG